MRLEPAFLAAAHLCPAAACPRRRGDRI